MTLKISPDPSLLASARLFLETGGVNVYYNENDRGAAQWLREIIKIMR